MQNKILHQINKHRTRDMIANSDYFCPENINLQNISYIFLFEQPHKIILMNKKVYFNVKLLEIMFTLSAHGLQVNETFHESLYQKYLYLSFS